MFCFVVWDEGLRLKEGGGSTRAAKMNAASSVLCRGVTGLIEKCCMSVAEILALFTHPS